MYGACVCIACARVLYSAFFKPVPLHHGVRVQLCATGHGRKVLREKQTYVIIRELHQWETEPVVAEACEHLIGMLIADEPEPELENLHKVAIPDHILKDFEEDSNVGSSEVCRQDAEDENQSS